MDRDFNKIINASAEEEKNFYIQCEIFRSFQNRLGGIEIKQIMRQWNTGKTKDALNNLKVLNEKVNLAVKMWEGDLK